MTTHRPPTLAVLVAAAALGACQERIVNIIPVASVQVSGPSGTLLPGGTVQLSATARDDRNNALTDRSVSWSSSNSGVASVSSGGMVQAVGAGNATITAQVEGVNGTATIAVNNPVPVVTTLAPALAIVGTGAFELSVTGTGFVPGSVVLWNGQDRTTQYVSATTLKASITAADVAATGGFNVTVRNPQPGGGSSAAKAFAVNNPIPVITSFSPTSTVWGERVGFILTVNGMGFVQGAVIRFKGQDHPTTFVNSTRLTTLLSTGDLAAPALVDVTVVNPIPGGGASSVRQYVVGIEPPGPTIAARLYHTCAVRGNGETYCWGLNDSGQLGDGTNTDRTAPSRVATTLPFVSIVAGYYHTCGLTQWGATYCWGSNALGSSSGWSSNTPVPVSGGYAFIHLTAGAYHACGVTAAGALYCWGDNWRGQLGDGSTSARSTPVQVGAGQTWRRVFGGSYHTCGITTAGRMYCWGYNYSGQLGEGTTTDHALPTAISGSTTFSTAAAGYSHTCAVGTTGAAYCWGWGGFIGNSNANSSSVPLAVSSGQAFTALSASSNHTCGLTPTGGTLCWGYNDSGQLGNGGLAWTGPPVAVNAPAMKAIAASQLHSCGIATTGVAYCWGERAYGGVGDGNSGVRPSPMAVSNASSGYTAIAAGVDFSCGLSGTSPRCWGRNSAGQLGDGTYSYRLVPAAVSAGYAFAQITAGSNHACGLTAAGNGYCWGANWYGGLGNGSYNDSNVPVSVAGYTFSQIGAGSYSTCGVTRTGEVRCWGDNWSGQLGDGTTVSRPSPTAVTGVSGLTFSKVSMGNAHACAVTTTGQLYCWGDNASGQLGDGTMTRRPAPVRVNIGAAVASVTLGMSHTCAVTTAGAGYCWGNAGWGSTGTGTSSNNLTVPTPVVGGYTFRSINAGYYTTCGVTTNDVAFCWGANDWGQTGTGDLEWVDKPTLVAGGGGYQEVRPGNTHACGLTTAGAVRCWGRLRFGELGTGELGVVLDPVAVQGGVVFNQESCFGESCGVTALSLPARRLFSTSSAGIHHVRPLPRVEPIRPDECRAQGERCPPMPVRIVR